MGILLRGKEQEEVEAWKQEIPIECQGPDPGPRDVVYLSLVRVDIEASHD